MKSKKDREYSKKRKQKNIGQRNTGTKLAIAFLVAMLGSACASGITAKKNKSNAWISESKAPVVAHYKDENCSKRDRSLRCYDTAFGVKIYPLHVDSFLITTYKKHGNRFKGIDVLCRFIGDPVYAVADGVVDYVGQRYMVRLKHDTFFGARKSVYTHIRINRDEIEKGMEVRAGDIVGWCDVIGVDNGEERFPKGVLHFEWQQNGSGKYKRIDPLNGRRKKARYENRNGFPQS